MQVPGAGAAGSMVFSLDETTPEETYEPDESGAFADLSIDNLASSKSESGRRVKGPRTEGAGRYIRAGNPRKGEKGFDVAFDATLRAAAVRQVLNAKEKSPFYILPSDLKKKVRLKKPSSLIVFCVDASDSMGVQQRMSAAKGAVISLLAEAYQKRDRVSLVIFRNENAKIVLPPTGSVALARRKLKRLPSGGATPFAHGLKESWRLIRLERVKDPHLTPLLVIISDGEANIPLYKGNPVMEELLNIAQAVSGDEIPSIVLDTKPGKNEILERFSTRLGAKYHKLSRLVPEKIIRTIHEDMAEAQQDK